MPDNFICLTDFLKILGFEHGSGVYARATQNSEYV